MKMCYVFIDFRPVSLTWSIFPGCITGTPALTLARPSAMCVEKLCPGSPLTAFHVKVNKHISLVFFNVSLSQPL